MWGCIWGPQWPKRWDPNLGCSVVPKGRTPNSCGVGIPNDPTDGSRTRGALGSPMAKLMDPKAAVHWDPQCPHRWIPNPWCFGVPYVPLDGSQTRGALGSPVVKPMDPKPMVCWDPQ